MPTPEERELIDFFVDVFEKLELDPATDSAARDGDVRYHRFPNGRAGTGLKTEVFFVDVPALEAIARAQAIGGGAPHMLSQFGPRGGDDAEVYRAHGYQPVGTWMLMRRSLETALLQPRDERAQMVSDEETEHRLIAAIQDHGGTEHPVQQGSYRDTSILQCWVPVDNRPAAFGRAIVMGTRAYLGAMITFPEFRRRGFGGSIARTLLDRAREAGAQECVLVSTGMGHSLYRSLGFGNFMSLMVYEFPGPGAEEWPAG